MFDVVVIVFVGLLALIGLWKGFVRQIVGLAGVVVGFVVAMKFAGPLAARFLTGFRPATGHIIGFVVIFVGCMIVASIIAWMLGKVLNIVGLGIINRLAGGLLGGAKGYLIVAVATMLMIAYLPHDSGLLRGSWTLDYIRPMADRVSKFAPGSIRMKYEGRVGRPPHLPHKDDGKPDRRQDRLPDRKPETELFI